MRTNLPVTHQEFEFPEDATLVSTTDLQSRITYCNPAFIAVSGYTREELLGQPHNLIRHPDMPPEAFRDMWETLQSGFPWSALVKNRRKNGDYYWVKANATPMVENGQTVGYLSVRTKPTRAAIDAAEALYQRMRDEVNAPTLALHRGQRVHTGLRGTLQRALRMTLGHQLTLLTSLTALAGLGAGAALSGAGTAAWAGGAASVLLLGAGGAALLRRQIVQPLFDAIRFANRMAAGDLSARFEGTGGGDVGLLANSLNQLNVNLQAVVSDVRHEVEGVHAASNEIAAGNHDLSSRTESQASSLEQTAASMEELTSTVEQSAASARQAATLSLKAAQVARDGNTAMKQVIATMDDISHASSRIRDIIQVIDGISFQTNILALNAAVEAARAGEQGRGFAVVAGEVRSLAQRTLAAAKEIKGLIDASAEKVGQGSQLVHNTGLTMGNVVTAVEQVNALITDITSATQEQSMGIAQINQAVGQLDAMTQQNSAMVEELAAAASSLQGQAVVVQDAVRIFRLQRRSSVPQARTT